MEERRESKDQEILELKEQMKKLDSNMQIYKAEFMYYVLEYGVTPGQQELYLVQALQPLIQKSFRALCTPANWYK